MMDMFAMFLLGVAVTSLFAMVIHSAHMNSVVRAYEAGKKQSQTATTDETDENWWKEGRKLYGDD